MTVEKLKELSDENQVVDIWRVADIILDMRPENELAADIALASLNISDDGPKVILDVRLKSIIEEYQENISESD